MVAEAVVQEEAFLSPTWADIVMLCTDMVALTGPDATFAPVDESVLAEVPVPKDSLIHIDGVTSFAPEGDGDDGSGDPPRASVRLTCSDARIKKVIEASRRLDPATRTRNVMVWILRVTTPDGAVLDYRFRATLGAMVSYGGPRGDEVVNVFLDTFDVRPTVTRPQPS